MCSQIVGILLVGAFTVIFSLITWCCISYFLYRVSDSPESKFQVFKYLRVSPREEAIGLDSLFTDIDNNIEQLKRDYLQSQREKRSWQRKFNRRKLKRKDMSRYYK